MSKQNRQDAYTELQMKNLKRREEQAHLLKEEKPSMKYLHLSHKDRLKAQKRGDRHQCPSNI